MEVYGLPNGQLNSWQLCFSTEWGSNLLLSQVSVETTWSFVRHFYTCQQAGHLYHLQNHKERMSLFFCSTGGCLLGMIQSLVQVKEYFGYSFSDSQRCCKRTQLCMACLDRMHVLEVTEKTTSASCGTVVWFRHPDIWKLECIKLTCSDRLFWRLLAVLNFGLRVSSISGE